MMMMMNTVTQLHFVLKSGEVKTVDERETESMLSVKPCDTFINKISNFIKASSPAFIFNPSKSRKRRRKMLTKMIHPELQCLWKHLSQLFTGQIIQSESSSPSVPKVDWDPSIQVDNSNGCANPHIGNKSNGTTN